MKLKCETILDIYTHKNTKILCQIKVQQPSKSDNKHQENREWKNTCRSITPEQWNSFDQELNDILKVLKDKRYTWKDETISTFRIKPNIEVKVKKSKLSTTNFYNFMGEAEDDDGGVGCVSDSGNTEGSNDNIKNFKQIVYVLEFILNFKPQLSSSSSVKETQEYQSKAKTTSSSANTVNKPLSYEEEETQLYTPKHKTSSPCNSPLSSYEPYTPSIKKYRTISLDGIKTPGADFLKHELFEDSYPSVTKSIKNTTRNDLPLPFKEKRSSKDSQTSQHSYNKDEEEVIDETDEEILSLENDGTIKSKDLKKKAKHEIENIPKSQEIVKATTSYPTSKEDKSTIKKDSQSEKKISKYHEKDKKELTETRKEVATTHQSKHAKKDNSKHSSSLDERERKSKEKLSSKESNEDKAKKILERRERTSTNDDELDNNRGIKKSQESSPINVSSGTTDSSPPKKNTKGKHKSSYDDTTQLRRSGRSPTKPKRLIEEQDKNLDKNKKKLKTQKSSPMNTELFGTDYDDDDEDDKGDDNNNDDTKIKPYVLQTPKCENPKKKSSSSSSSTKKKRKRDKSSECEQEKRDLKSWLGKKKLNTDPEAATTSKDNPKSSKKKTSSKDPKKIPSKSASPEPAEFVMPSKEEMEKIRVKTKQQQEQNELLKAELEKISAPPPKEVTTLSLKDMSVDDLLDTFADHKPILDEIYEKNCKKDHIKSHNGINHVFVIRLLEQKTQFKMLQKLTDIYSSSHSTTQATLYANAMLPEWIIRVYMDKHNFTRAEAMQQIKAQDEYQLHMEEISDNSFLLDDDMLT